MRSSSGLGFQPSQAVDPALASAVKVATAVCRLPAVALRDWCDRAAAAITNVAERSVAVVLVASVRPGWPTVEVEVSGAAADGANGSPDRHAFLQRMRCAGASVRHLGWTPPPDLPREGLARVISRPRGTDWKEWALSGLFGSNEMSGLVVGLVPIGAREHERFLAAYIGAPAGGDGAADAIAGWHASVVAACLPLLAGRAEAALQGTTAGKDRWISQREQAVLEHLATGLSVIEIAGVLNRSPHTVHDHIKALHRKLGTKARAELLARALGVPPALSAAALRPSIVEEREPSDRGVQDADGTGACAGPGSLQRSAGAPIL